MFALYNVGRALKLIGKDFKYVESNKEYIIDNIDLYTLDKKYLDIQYIVIDEVIFNLDELYFLCLEE